MDRRRLTAVRQRPLVTLAEAPSQLAAKAALHVAAAAALLTLGASRAWAAGPTMPWDTAVDNLLNNLSGPTARALVLIAIVGCGLFWAFTRNEEGLKKLGQIAFGGAIAMGATVMLTSLGFTGALM